MYDPHLLLFLVKDPSKLLISIRPLNRLSYFYFHVLSSGPEMNTISYGINVCDYVLQQCVKSIIKQKTKIKSTILLLFLNPASAAVSYSELSKLLIPSFCPANDPLDLSE